MYNYHSPFWLTWFVVTIIYIVGGLFLGGNSGGALLPVYIVGMFVPFGLGNTLASFSPIGLLTIPLVVGSFYAADRIAIKLNIVRVFQKTIFNLLWLFFLTLVVDLLIWHHWASLGLILNIIDPCYPGLFYNWWCTGSGI